MFLTCKYRLLPSKCQHAVLAAICEAQRALYHAAPEERIDCCRKTGKGQTYVYQAKALTPGRRDLPEMAALPSNLQQRTLKRLDEVEDLNSKGMVQDPILARSIPDASWAKFLFLEYKAERAGAHVIRIDPGNTSQRCSDCGELVPKSLAVRTHSCPHCGAVIDRDGNAAENILNAVGNDRGAGNVANRGERRLGNIGRAPVRESSI